MRLILPTILLCTLGAWSQNLIETEIDSIVSIEQAQTFTKTYKTASVITFNKEKHNTVLANQLFDKGLGGKKVYENSVEKIIYKIVDRYEVPYYRVSYIYFDGSKLSFDDIEKKRQSIINQYKSGIPFADLANQYSMDQNAKRGGDLGWITHGEVVQEFEDAIINQNEINSIYTIDLHERNWYYVILQTHAPKMIEEIKVLKYSQATR